MDSTALQRLHRTELLLGREVMARLRSVRVALFGVGGVGSWCAEALVRSGVVHLLLVDPVVVCATNINRQLQATAGNLGRPKVDELRDRLREIDPDASIQARKVLYNQDSEDQFDLRRFDYVLDAIDTLQNKVLLLRRCLEAGVTVFSSMGAAAKFDPTQIRTARLSRTKHCPLARMVRKRLRQQGVKGECLCVYSEEFPSENLGQAHGSPPACAGPDADEEGLCRAKARINGTLVHVTGAFGFALAGLLIQDVVRQSAPRPAVPPPSPPAGVPPDDAGTMAG